VRSCCVCMKKWGNSRVVVFKLFESGSLSDFDTFIIPSLYREGISYIRSYWLLN
jgi:hypothetical protein